MKKLFLFAIALGLMLNGCGGGLDVTMKPNTGFKRTSSVKVESDDFDGANLQPKIERALFKNGVEVRSPLLTRMGIQPQHEFVEQLASSSPRMIPDSASAGSSTLNGGKEGSEYLLEFTYSFNNSNSGDLITEFSATVVEAASGEIVGIINYHGGGTTADDLAESVGKKLGQELK